MLRLVTFNLANDLHLWTERAPLILAELERLAPDVLALQEVSLPFDNAGWLAEQLGGYQVIMGPKSRSRGEIEALAILSRLPVEDHDRLEFGDQDRVAMRAIVRQGDERWEVANAHLHWSLRDDVLRARQVRRMVDWLGHELPTIVCGDFNAKPGWKAVAIAREHYSSAHERVHGHEPHYTFPTPLYRGARLGPRSRHLASAMMRPVFNHPRAPWRTTLDYIFVDQRVEVLACDVAFDVPDPARPWLYPSDHLGLAAELALRS
jgi:endonuclease/exonuclease/phosphatase family metal-dependent hydrolase